MNPAIRPADADSRSLLQQARNLSTMLTMLALLLKDDSGQRWVDAEAGPEASSPMTNQLSQAAKDLRTQIASDTTIATIVPLIVDDLTLAERAARRAEYVTRRRLARVLSLVLSYVPFIAHDPLRTIIRKAPAKRKQFQAMLHDYATDATQLASVSRASASSGRHTRKHAVHGRGR